MPRRRRKVTQVDETPRPAGRYVEEEVVTPPPRRPLLWPWLALLLLLVGTGIALAYFLTRDDAEADRVPAVVGLREAEAVERLRDDGYPADVRRRVNQAQRGRVLQQMPDAGSELDDGETVVLIVARAPGTVDVPRVVGLRVAAAFERLQRAGLRGNAIEVFARRARGTVVRQVPAAGAEARRRSIVQLQVSKGPQLVAVPAVEGQTETQAGAALRQAGFKVNAVRVPAPDAPGTVLAQRPQGGARAPRGSTVRINVSEGSTTGTTTSAASVPMPNVLGQDEANAVAQIERAGLRARRVTVPSTRPAGTVLDQRPAQGTSVPRGATVVIIVSTAPRPAQSRTVPNVVGQDAATATQNLTRVGFRPRTVTEPVTDPAQMGIVLDQEPRPGQRRPTGTEVVIIVGRQG